MQFRCCGKCVYIEIIYKSRLPQLDLDPQAEINLNDHPSAGLIFALSLALA